MKIETLKQACEVFNRYSYQYEEIKNNDETIQQTKWVISTYANASTSFGLVKLYHVNDEPICYAQTFTKWEAITLAQALLDLHAKEEK